MKNDFRTPRDKREELKTYRELELGRGMKSKVQRRRIDAKGKQRVLGDGSSEHPYLPVDLTRYRQVRLEIQRRLLIEARALEIDLPADLLLGQLTPRIEELAYAQLADEFRHDAARHVPIAALGRAPTETERAQFADTHAVADNAHLQAGKAARLSATTALQRALGQIEQRQNHNPARYQTIWAQLVGPDAAVQSNLENVDPVTKIAWFRCYNSVLSSDLQRRPGLANKLAKALGVPIRQLRAKF